MITSHQYPVIMTITLEEAAHIANLTPAAMQAILADGLAKFDNRLILSEEGLHKWTANDEDRLSLLALLHEDQYKDVEDEDNH